MEKVILSHNRKYLDGIPGKVDRLYFGSEFCASLLPAPSDIDRLMALRRRQGVLFSIVTPYLHQRAMKPFLRLLTFLDRHCPGMEVVANDWGSVHLIREQFPGLEIVLGRALNRQKRAPFLKTSSGIVPLEELGLTPADKKYLRSSILQNDPLMHFVRQSGIRRLGLDNMRQGLIFGQPWMKVDLYYPYVYITTTDYCRQRPMAGAGQADGCCRSCRRGKARMGRDWVYTYGNTQFYFNGVLPVRLPAQVERIVRVVC